MNLQAVRTFNRLWNPIARQLNEAEVADAGFDGGEFSGPAHANIAEEEYYKLLRLVADRYGYNMNKLFNDVYAYEMEQADRYLVTKR